mgnify:CR=1 FL=1
MITVKFFAQLRERLDCNQIQLDGVSETTGEQVLQQLREKQPHWQTVLADQELLFAVNQELKPLSSPVRSGDELAFFPPVTGG